MVQKVHLCAKSQMLCWVFYAQDPLALTPNQKSWFMAKKTYGTISAQAQNLVLFGLLVGKISIFVDETIFRYSIWKLLLNYISCAFYILCFAFFSVHVLTDINLKFLYRFKVYSYIRIWNERLAETVYSKKWYQGDDDML